MLWKHNVLTLLYYYWQLAPKCKNTTYILQIASLLLLQPDHLSPTKTKSIYVLGPTEEVEDGNVW